MRLLIAIMFSPFEVFQVLLMRISFPFKSNLIVCFHLILVTDDQDDPFKDLPYIKRYIEKFPGLSCMDKLMV